jgi:hypothetical protein
MEWVCITIISCTYLHHARQQKNDRNKFISSTKVSQVQWLLVWISHASVKHSLYRPAQALRGPGCCGSQISRRSAHESGKIVSPIHWLPSPSRKYSWYSFLLQAESNPGPQCSRKDYVMPCGIEPTTLQLAAQCLNQPHHRMPPHKCRRCWNACYWPGATSALYSNSWNTGTYYNTLHQLLWFCLRLQSPNRPTLISGFHHDTDELCAALGYYTASCGNGATQRRILSQNSADLNDGPLREQVYQLAENKEQNWRAIQQASHTPVSFIRNQQTW